ncbi:hypothetical protein B0H14DRAFT_3158948 [Mycena olivaceomarginata]|nr:hypothetical protein B0H14DRAFT_3158948 [Mycena olivaceomarginata]
MASQTSNNPTSKMKRERAISSRIMQSPGILYDTSTSSEQKTRASNEGNSGDETPRKEKPPVFQDSAIRLAAHPMLVEDAHVNEQHRLHTGLENAPTTITPMIVRRGDRLKKPSQYISALFLGEGATSNLPHAPRTPVGPGWTFEQTQTRETPDGPVEKIKRGRRPSKSAEAKRKPSDKTNAVKKAIVGELKGGKGVNGRRILRKPLLR